VEREFLAEAHVANQPEGLPDEAAAEETRMQDIDEPIPDTIRAFPKVAAFDELNGILGTLGDDEVAVLVRIAIVAYARARSVEGPNLSLG
jgi:hypothetical protein